MYSELPLTASFPTAPLRATDQFLRVPVAASSARKWERSLHSSERSCPRRTACCHKGYGIDGCYGWRGSESRIHRNVGTQPDEVLLGGAVDASKRAAGDTSLPHHPDLGMYRAIRPTEFGVTAPVAESTGRSSRCGADCVKLPPM